ncbi:MAG: hypothetical protein IPL35_17280 [Sphingobacteriales bacterium]|nr:hypothetical protein [Sphingobacteriales bacterium]
MESCGEHYGDDDLYLYPWCGAMCKYSDHDGDGEPQSYPYVQSDCGDLLRRLITLPSSSTNSPRWQLESCGEHYSDDNLYIHACCGAMCKYGDLDSDGECPCHPYIQSDSGNLFGRLHYLAIEFNKQS